MFVVGGHILTKYVYCRLKVTPDWNLLLDFAATSVKNCVVGIGAVESSFFCQTTPAIKDFLDPELAPLLVFLQYLTQVEVNNMKNVLFNAFKR